MSEEGDPETVRSADKKPSHSCYREIQSTVQRRAVLRTVGTVAAISSVSLPASATETDPIGYGDGGYGAGGYGGTTGTETEPNRTPPSVSTDRVTDLTADSVTLLGEVETLGDYESVAAFFEWGPADTSELTATTTQQLEVAGTFSTAVTDLEADTDYIFQAVASTESSYEKGSTRSFKTETAQDSSDEEQNEETEPLTIETVELTDRSNPAWTRTRVTWSVSSGVDLERCTSELYVDGSVVDSETSTLEGAAASGSHELRTRTQRGANGSPTVEYTVTDSENRVKTETLPL